MEHLISQANELLAAGKQNAAALLAKSALLIVDETPARDLPFVVGDLERLANLYAHHKRPLEAELLFKRLLDICEKEQAVPSEMTRVLNTVGSFYFDLGRTAEAKAMFERAIEVGRTGGQQVEMSTFFANLNLARVLRDEGRPQEALHIIERELDIDSMVDKDGDFFVPEMLDFTADLYGRLGRLIDAERLLVRAHELWSRQAAPHIGDFSQSLRNLAMLYQRQGRHEEAGQLTARAALLEEHGDAR